MIYIGIDIGVNGCITALTSDGKVHMNVKMPENRYLLLEALRRLDSQKCVCLLEKVHCRPTNGSKANFTFGEQKERTLFALEVCGIAYSETTPQAWMKAYMLKRDKNETGTQWKNRLKQKAMQLFPNEKVTLWNADGLLIAEALRRSREKIQF